MYHGNAMTFFVLRVGIDHRWVVMDGGALLMKALSIPQLAPLARASRKHTCTVTSRLAFAGSLAHRARDYVNVSNTNEP